MLCIGAVDKNIGGQIVVLELMGVWRLSQNYYGLLTAPPSPMAAGHSSRLLCQMCVFLSTDAIKSFVRARPFHSQVVDRGTGLHDYKERRVWLRAKGNSF